MINGLPKNNSSDSVQASIVIFDQGNTLIMDPFPTVLDLQKEIFQAILRQYFVSAGISDFLEAWKNANKVIDYPFATHFSQEEPFIQYALRQIKVPPDIAAILGPELLHEYRVGLRQVIITDPRTTEVRETLETLQARGKKLGVFSNDRIIGLGSVLKAMQIESLFQYVETSDMIGIEKPDPRVFQRILTHFSTRPQDIVYVGDDLIRDVDAAKSQGLKAILYRVDAQAYDQPWRNYSIKSRYQPDAAVNKFSDLLKIIA